MLSLGFGDYRTLSTETQLASRWSCLCLAMQIGLLVPLLLILKATICSVSTMRRELYLLHVDTNPSEQHA